MLYQIALAGQDENGNWEDAGFANGGYAYATRALAAKLADRLGTGAIEVPADDEARYVEDARFGRFGPQQVFVPRARTADDLILEDIPF